MEGSPADFVLKAHHVGVLVLLILALKDFEGKLPPPFLLHVLRLLLQEVVEVAPPRTCHELCIELETAPKAEEEAAALLINAFKMKPHILNSAEELTNFFAVLPPLFIDKTENDDEITQISLFHRRSVIGFFCRRCFITFLKLSFNGVGKLQKEYKAWSDGQVLGSHEFPVVKDDLHNDLQIYQTADDKVSWAKPEPFSKWQSSISSGDEHTAIENLRKYFEQHFHDSTSSGYRQNALLNLVRMHYLRQEYPTARKLLSEAIGVARTSNDKITLAHCIGLLNRFPPTIEGRRPTLNQIQADTHPLEVLFDVSKLMDEENGQPLSASFEKIVQAVGLYDHWFDTQPIAPRETEQWAQHVVQSVVWSAAGCDALAVIEEDLVVAFTDIGGIDNNRITAILNQAYREARQGRYEQSLAALLHPNVWRRLSMIEYEQWAQEVWHILVLWAARRGQDRAYREILLPNRPPGEYKPRTYLLAAAGSKLSKLNDPLWDVIQMQHCDQAASAVDGLLTSLWQAEFLGRLNVYRTGMILLADVGMEFGMTKRSRRILEEIIPQMILGHDIEQRALACFTLARCIIVAEDNQEEGLEQALRYLTQAAEDYSTLGMLQATMDVQYYLSVVNENLGRKADSDAAGERHFATQDLHKGVEGSLEGFSDVLAVVRHVGATIAVRSRD